jgi:acetylornithine deacetylase/succinyl-diaminopimelate desuccinylase-like protein
VIGKFSELWPDSQFLITGVLGPNSNAHGPNEFLHIDYTRRLIGSMANIIAGVSGLKAK